jgi:hypothetical protein
VVNGWRVIGVVVFVAGVLFGVIAAMELIQSLPVVGLVALAVAGLLCAFAISWLDSTRT